MGEWMARSDQVQRVGLDQPVKIAVYNQCEIVCPSIKIGFCSERMFLHSVSRSLAGDFKDSKPIADFACLIPNQKVFRHHWSICCTLTVNGSNKMSNFKNDLSQAWWYSSVH